MMKTPICLLVFPNSSGNANGPLIFRQRLFMGHVEHWRPPPSTALAKAKAKAKTLVHMEKMAPLDITASLMLLMETVATLAAYAEATRPWRRWKQRRPQLLWHYEQRQWRRQQRWSDG